MTEEYSYGVCGVFCEMCPTGKGTFSELAGKLLKLMENDFKWAKDEVDFDFGEVRKGLEWLSGVKCPGCRKIEEPWCEVLKCQRAIELGSCLLCDEMAECRRLEYHRGRYPFILQHRKRVGEVGLEKHLAEERERASKGTCLFEIRSY